MYTPRSIIISAILLVAGTPASSNSDCPTIVTRSQWGAAAPTSTVAGLKVTPAPNVVIHHAVTIPCMSQAICQAKVRTIQTDHISNRNFADIGYNFLIGEDGNVYEGRGWDKRGAHAVQFNSKSVGICFIGNFSNRQPSVAAINAAKKLIQCGISKGKISNTYKLMGHRQIGQTNCPGTQLYDMIKTWPHWQANP